MTKEEILKEYCLSEVKDIPKDLIGWRVLELIPVIEEKKDDKLTLGSFLNKQTICYKTKEERWLGEFRFLLSTTNIGTLVVVDQSCPDYYFIEKEDLLEPVRQLVDIMENPWTLKDIDIRFPETTRTYTQTFSVGDIYSTTTAYPANSIVYDSASKMTYISMPDNTLEPLSSTITAVQGSTSSTYYPDANFTMKIDYSDSTTC